MILSYELRRQAFLPPQSVGSNTTPTSAIIDTKGYSFARIAVDIGVTNIALAALSLSHSDLSNMAGGAVISGTNFGGDNNDTGSASVLPAANQSNTSFGMLVDLRGKKRYIQLTLTTAVAANNAALVSAYADLSRPDETPRSASEAGMNQRMIA